MRKLAAELGAAVTSIYCTSATASRCRALVERTVPELGEIRPRGGPAGHASSPSPAPCAGNWVPART